MAGILVYSDKTSLALELISAASLIAQDKGQIIRAASVNNAEQAEELAAKGIDVLKVNASALSLADTAAVASVLQQLAEQMDANIILLSSNRRGKELAGRLAEICKAGCLTDVKNIQSENGTLICIRNVLGGATIAAQKINTAKQVIAISAQSFPAASNKDGGKIDECKVEITPSRLRLIETREKARDSVNIEAAEILIVVGQGVESKEDLPLIEEIATAFGGVVACSKPVASDKKWLGEERIVGLSGKICKPKLAIILGVSGQVQFTVGIRDAGTIVSINNDEKAFMNNMADYFLVADLKEVLPALKRAIG